MCGVRLFGLTPWFVSVMCVVAAGTVHAAEPPGLTEHAAIALALPRPVFREADQGRIATAESAVVEASLLPNPVRGTLVDPGDQP